MGDSQAISLLRRIVRAADSGTWRDGAQLSMAAHQSIEDARALLFDFGEEEPAAISLNERRADKANDNALWSPLECAVAFVRDIRKGEISPSRLIVLYEQPEADGGMAIAAYLANVQRDTEIALLHMRLHNATHKWQKQP